MEHTEKGIHKYFNKSINDLLNKVINISILNKSFNSIPTNELMPVIDEINLGFNKLDKLVRLIENMNNDVSFEGILNYIYSTFSEFIP